MEPYMVLDKVSKKGNPGLISVQLFFQQVEAFMQKIFLQWEFVFADSKTQVFEAAGKFVLDVFQNIQSFT